MTWCVLLWHVIRVWTLVQVAADFGIHVATLDKWLRQERIGSGEQEGVCRSGAQELRDLRRRNRLLEQENEVSWRAAAYLSQANPPGRRYFPLVKQLASEGTAATLTCRVLKAVPGPVLLVVGSAGHRI